MHFSFFPILFLIMLWVMDKRQARLVPDDLLSFIVVFISFVKRDEVFVKFNRNQILDHFMNETKSYFCA